MRTGGLIPNQQQFFLVVVGLVVFFVLWSGRTTDRFSESGDGELKIVHLPCENDHDSEKYPGFATSNINSVQEPVSEPVIVEKIVEKIVEREIEKPCPNVVECPKVNNYQAQRAEQNCPPHVELSCPICPKPSNSEPSTENCPSSSSYIPESSEDTSLPFCDDMFKSDFITGQKYNVDSRKLMMAKRFYNKHMHDELDGLLRETGVENGCWSPKSYCRVRQRVAIVVPYRDRTDHLTPFLLHLHKFLQYQHREYCIVLSEQFDKGQFNRAKLMNVGFDYATKDLDYWKSQGKKPDCFIFHDVDLLPEDLKNLYGCFGYQANHMCDKFDKYQYKTQYIPGGVVSSGGVISVPFWQYKTINGHANRYFGWGFEDHDGGMRMRAYDADRDDTVPGNRKKDTDYMNEYFVGVTNEGGGTGMARSDGHGFYHQIQHMHSFTSGNDGAQFAAKTMLEKQKEYMFEIK